MATRFPSWDSNRGESTPGFLRRVARIGLLVCPQFCKCDASPPISADSCSTRPRGLSSTSRRTWRGRRRLGTTTTRWRRLLLPLRDRETLSSRRHSESPRHRSCESLVEWGIAAACLVCIRIPCSLPASRARGPRAVFGAEVEATSATFNGHVGRTARRTGPQARLFRSVAYLGNSTRPTRSPLIAIGWALRVIKPQILNSS